MYRQSDDRFLFSAMLDDGDYLIYLYEEQPHSKDRFRSVAR